MTSNKGKEILKKFKEVDGLLEPKTPHEEVMFVVESTNEIVSEIADLLKKPPKCRLQSMCPFFKEEKK